MTESTVCNGNQPVNDRESLVDGEQKVSGGEIMARGGDGRRRVEERSRGEDKEMMYVEGEISDRRTSEDSPSRGHRSFGSITSTYSPRGAPRVTKYESTPSSRSPHKTFCSANCDNNFASSFPTHQFDTTNVAASMQYNGDVVTLSIQKNGGDTTTLPIDSSGDSVVKGGRNSFSTSGTGREGEKEGREGSREGRESHHRVTFAEERNEYVSSTPLPLRPMEPSLTPSQTRRAEALLSGGDREPEETRLMRPSIIKPARTAVAPGAPPLTPPTVHLTRIDAHENHDNPFSIDGELRRKADYILQYSTISRRRIRISDPDDTSSPPPSRDRQPGSSSQVPLTAGAECPDSSDVPQSSPAYSPCQQTDCGTEQGSFVDVVRNKSLPPPSFTPSCLVNTDGGDAEDDSPPRRTGEKVNGDGNGGKDYNISDSFSTECVNFTETSGLTSSNDVVIDDVIVKTGGDGGGGTRRKRRRRVCCSVQ